MSAVAIAQFALESNALIDRHRNELLKIAIWKVTVARESRWKYATRFRSPAVLGVVWSGKGRCPLRQDHVPTKDSLIRKMQAQPEQVETILPRAEACTVTVAEHSLLSGWDKTYTGWDRYLAAGIDVMDMATENKVITGGRITGPLPEWAPT